MNLRSEFLTFCLLFLIAGCNNNKHNNSELSDTIKLITLDPGHFHAALVQKSMYKNVDSSVFIYAPEGPDLTMHLERINRFNSRSEKPTQWNSIVYSENDFFEKMLEEKKGNVVILAGNNQSKTDYIHRSIDEGFNVLADKPMAISKLDFELLKDAFIQAKKNELLLYDIMTERYEITSILQKELSRIPEIYGDQEKGTIDNPAVTKESIHHFFKYVSGNILTRPAWFFDVEQEGEGLVDVMTHLVDLIQWECFPDQIINIPDDIEIHQAKRYPTQISRREFSGVTGIDNFPDFLQKDVVRDSLLEIYCNGEIIYQLKGIHAKVSVQWAYKAPEGTGDTHYSIMRGTKANLIIRQGDKQQFKPVLYIAPVIEEPGYKTALLEQIDNIRNIYPGIDVKKINKEWEVIIPEEYRKGHEAHFAQVMEKFISYLQNNSLPEWEIPNMIAKYYTTTTALEMAKSK